MAKGVCGKFGSSGRVSAAVWQADVKQVTLLSIAASARWRKLQWLGWVGWPSSGLSTCLIQKADTCKNHDKGVDVAGPGLEKCPALWLNTQKI